MQHQVPAVEDLACDLKVTAHVKGRVPETQAVNMKSSFGICTWLTKNLFSNQAVHLTGVKAINLAINIANRLPPQKYL